MNELTDRHCGKPGHEAARIRKMIDALRADRETPFREKLARFSDLFRELNLAHCRDIRSHSA
jgi:hypothetical protein